MDHVNKRASRWTAIVSNPGKFGCDVETLHN